MIKRFSRNHLFVVFAGPIVFDVVGTVLGQPEQYWSSGFRVFREALPVYPLLQWHPLLFVAVCLGFWLPITYYLTLKLREPWNLWVTLSLLIIHSYNSIAWFRLILRNLWNIQGGDQLTQAVALVPVAVYVLAIGWVATLALTAYLKNRPA